MKKILIMVFLIVWVIFISAKEVKNQDQPLRGNWDFGLKKIWETSTAGEEVLVDITALRVDRNGNLFVFDRKTSRFHVFSPQDEFLYSFGKRGEGPGEYRMVFNFFLEKNRIIVPDMNRIHFFDLSGKFIKTEISGSAFLFPRVFVDPDRFIYVPSRHGSNKKSDSLELVNLKTKQTTLICELPVEDVLEATASREGGPVRLNVKDANTTPGVIVGFHDHFLFFGKNDKYLIKKPI